MYHGKPPCDGCSWAVPGLLEENEEIFELLVFCARQVRIASGGPMSTPVCVGFDLPAVLAVAERLGVQVGRHEMLKIHAIENVITERSTENDDCKALTQA